MHKVKVLSTNELLMIVGGENDSRMPYELNKPNNLSKGGAVCGLSLAGGLLSGSTGGVPGVIGGLISGVAGCL